MSGMASEVYPIISFDAERSWEREAEAAAEQYANDFKQGKYHLLAALKFR